MQGARMEQQLKRLISAFCDLTGLQDPDAIAEGQSFNVDEVECAIIYQGHTAPENIYCYIDYGLPPRNQLPAIYDQLLKSNYLTFCSTKATFSLSPHTGHVILAVVLNLAETTANSLIEHFSYQAQQALAWRENFSLLDVDSDEDLPLRRDPISYS